MNKLYYCHEEEYPYLIWIMKDGESVRLPLEQYCREFSLDPNNIMLMREEFQKRLAKVKEKPEPLKQEGPVLTLWDEVRDDR